MSVFYPLRRDATFKYMMRSKKFRIWFSEIIEDKCGINLMEYDYIDPVLTEGNNSKDYELDTLVRDTEGNYVIIEMQNYQADSKNLRYLFRVAGNTLKKGETYKFGNVVLIQLDGYVPKGIKKDILHYELREETTNDVKKGVEIYEIVLPNFSKRSYNEINRRLSLFMCDSLEEMKEIESKGTSEIIDELEVMFMDENFSFLMDKEVYRNLELQGAKEQGYDEGHEEGYDEGHEDGITQGKTELIKSMIENKMTDEEIIKIAKITQEELNVIKEN